MLSEKGPQGPRTSSATGRLVHHGSGGDIGNDFFTVFWIRTCFNIVFGLN